MSTEGNGAEKTSDLSVSVDVPTDSDVSKRPLAGLSVVSGSLHVIVMMRMCLRDVKQIRWWKLLNRPLVI